MSIDVFISYNKDDESLAEYLCNKLNSKEIITWFAKRDIDYGENYARKIFDAIEQAKIFSVLISVKSGSSFHVKNEIELATRQIQRGIIIMPILLQKGEIDEEIQYYLARQQWLDISNPPIQEKIDKYCEYIESIIDNEDNRSSSNKNNKKITSVEAKNYKDYAKIGNFQRAIELLKNEIDNLNSSNIGINTEIACKYNELGSFHKIIGNYDKALMFLKKAMEFAPDHAISSIDTNIADVYMRQNFWDKAIENYTQALTAERLEFGHHRPSTLVDRSNAYFKKGDFKRALNDYKEASKLET